MTTCPACNGVIGRDCFNPEECMQITQDQAMRYRDEWPQTAMENHRIREVNADLLDACQAMIRCTGGSQHWHGETHEALKLIEAAIEMATKDGG